MVDRRGLGCRLSEPAVGNILSRPRIMPPVKRMDSLQLVQTWAENRTGQVTFLILVQVTRTPTPWAPSRGSTSVFTAGRR
jgi:hypothetical protein